jgi:hypothetical protein
MAEDIVLEHTPHVISFFVMSNVLLNNDESPADSICKNHKYLLALTFESDKYIRPTFKQCLTQFSIFSRTYNIRTLAFSRMF